MTKWQLLAICGTNIKYVVPITGEILSPDKVIVSNSNICFTVRINKWNSNEAYYALNEGLQPKPIFRPLSDLIKKIEHNGVVFIPTHMFSCEFEFMLNHAETYDFKSDYPFKVLDKLIEWRFDILGLIEKGEAIDVNTLPENPYK